MQRIHFVGIGGAGMAPLAKIALEQGFHISGSDRQTNSKIKQLIAQGANIKIGHEANFLPDEATLLVYSSAVPPENPERQKAAQLNIPQERRGEFLARLANKYRRVVAVSGSHGKTSITALIVHILKCCNVPAGYLIGGVVKDYPSGAAGDGDIFVTEADESDATHTALNSYIAVVPNADDDHSWSVGGKEALHLNFEKFASKAKNLLYYSDCVAATWFKQHLNSQILDSQNIPTTELDFLFGYQKSNAFLALEAVKKLGVDESQAIEAIHSFCGVARRMTIHKETQNLTIIEDYAHHPIELHNAIEFLRQKYPNHHLRILFQPHRYARLALYFERFATELQNADSAFIVPVFAAWSEGGSIDSAQLVNAIGNKATLLNNDWTDVANAILAPTSKPLLLAIVGAGDIEQVLLYLK